MIDRTKSDGSEPVQHGYGVTLVGRVAALACTLALTSVVFAAETTSQIIPEFKPSHPLEGRDSGERRFAFLDHGEGAASVEVFDTETGEKTSVAVSNTGAGKAVRCATALETALRRTSRSPKIQRIWSYVRAPLTSEVSFQGSGCVFFDFLPAGSVFAYTDTMKPYAADGETKTEHLNIPPNCEYSSHSTRIWTSNPVKESSKDIDNTEGWDYRVSPLLDKNRQGRMEAKLITKGKANAWDAGTSIGIEVTVKLNCIAAKGELGPVILK